MVCTCRLVWEVAWLLGIFCWLNVVLFLHIPTCLPVEVVLVEDESRTQAKELLATILHRPIQLRRPPILITTMPECYCVWSQIQLKMSSLILFQHIFAMETLAAERLRVLQSKYALGWIIDSVTLLSLMMMCLLFRKPPDRLFSMNDFIIEVKSGVRG